MCAGLKMKHFRFIAIKKLYDERIYCKLEECYDFLCQHKNSKYNLENLKKRLIITMNNLINLSLKKKNKIKIMEDTMKCVPSCCIDIVYNYQIEESFVKYIDWSKY